MSAPDVKAIKARMAACAKPGPWGVADCQQDGNGVTWIHFISPLYLEQDEDGETMVACTSPEEFIAETLDNEKDDSLAQFLAHSWQDITDLLAENAELRAQLSKRRCVTDRAAYNRAKAAAFREAAAEMVCLDAAVTGGCSRKMRPCNGCVQAARFLGTASALERRGKKNILRASRAG